MKKENMRTLASVTPEKINETVTLKGWVQTRRDHGGLIFVDLRDHTGIVQLVFHPEQSESFAIAETLRDEFVVSVTGVVKEREGSLKNDNIETGGIEIVVASVSILNRAEALPIQPFAEAQAGEELRLKYRFLDLRRPKMQQMLKRRAAYYKVLRDYMEAHDFTEVVTPILANSSPEGARDFLVPSRVHQGRFYALPQAPQQFKQLLMVGGVSRYFQIATCFRDEDPRADRLYGDFYQLDLEMSFVEDGEEVRSLMEPLIKNLVTDFGGKQLVSETVPRIPYEEAMNRYGSDKPDLRFDMELKDLGYIFEETEFGVFKSAECIKGILVKSGASLSRKQIDGFTDIAKSEGAGGLAYIKYTDVRTEELQSGELRQLDLKVTPESPIAKFLSSQEHIALVEAFQPENGDVIFFGADTRQIVNKVLGKLRSEFADYFGLKDPNKVALAWIVDFPFYEWDDARKKVDFGHNPFSMPRGGEAALLWFRQARPSLRHGVKRPGLYI